MKDEVPRACALCNALVVGEVLLGLFIPKCTSKRAFIYALCAKCRAQADCLDRIEEKITYEANIM